MPVAAAGGKRERGGHDIGSVRGEHGCSVTDEFVGNFRVAAADYLVVECESCRDALSARLDGEAEGHDPGDVDAHLNVCSDCGDWLATVTTVTRELRVRPLAEVPDLVDAILAAAPPAHRPRLRLRGHGARWVLAGIGCVQSVLGAAQMLGVQLGSSMPGAGHHMTDGTGADMAGHLFNESAAWNFALGLALLWAALRPRAIAGLLPTVAVFVAGLAVFVVTDLAKGAVTPERALSHLVVVAALGALLWVRRESSRNDAPTPGHMRADVARRPEDAGSGTDHPVARTSGSRGRHLRPAGRRAA
ncbi:zf-HC2 domain-containing protein [Skermania piniformis]|uniref:Zf-HC2 domain-containing protein n=1 Tax=Skermania pinensis TaxID=39122 RepID=A0ABX8S6R4_9ACTN|nr:zf-HC2 domain-containing protein [Skermania piniformis]QXQ13151.1 zf-HC2 domain-containing protein [Skermania piniformis]